jgi:phosphatidylglycerol:prolipoprotein diacylglycerol transferase
MDPVALDLGFMVIKWYSVMAASAMLSCLYVGRYWAVRYGLDEDKFLTLGIILVPAVLVGGRIGYVLGNLSYFREFPEEILRIDHGGLGSHGAVTVVLLTGYVAAKTMKLPFWTTADAFAPALPLSYMFTRFGNFANGELYGLPTDLPWGVVFPGTSRPVHPSMLYEALGEIVILVLALRWCASRSRDGEAFLKAGFCMAVLRVLVDFTRSGGDGPLLGLALTQVLSVIIAVACVALLHGRAAIAHQGKESVEYGRGA